MYVPTRLIPSFDCKMKMKTPKSRTFSHFHFAVVNEGIKLVGKWFRLSKNHLTVPVVENGLCGALLLLKIAPLL